MKTIQDCNDCHYLDDCSAELQRILCAQVYYCENQCPTRETCVDGKRTKEQERCALFTKEVPE